jgi:hypothetical protein
LNKSGDARLSIGLGQPSRFPKFEAQAWNVDCSSFQLGNSGVSKE